MHMHCIASFQTIDFRQNKLVFIDDVFMKWLPVSPSTNHPQFIIYESGPNVVSTCVGWVRVRVSFSTCVGWYCGKLLCVGQSFVALLVILI